MSPREIILNTNTCEEPSCESTTRQERLAALNLLCIEFDVLRELDSTELTDDFASSSAVKHGCFVLKLHSGLINVPGLVTVWRLTH